VDVYKKADRAEQQGRFREAADEPFV